MLRYLPPRHRGSRYHLYAPATPLHNCPNPSCPLCTIVAPARAAALRAVGGRPAHKRPPLPSGDTLRAGWLAAGTTLVAWSSVRVTPCRQATGGRCHYGLASSEHRPLRAGRGWVLPLWPGYGQASPWPLAIALAKGLVMASYPLSSLRSL
ncbi:hypothetical protein B296_00040766 [Ensete ventricosum]|uniref:Uncharacterized protein n=1 Tax=Ensete ventricosum TaxID=4639 RepID=A0A426WYL2_ENSVE|nr:hypothetical protein B296_00040766 [Ensete ventricosum]